MKHNRFSLLSDTHSEGGGNDTDNRPLTDEHIPSEDDGHIIQLSPKIFVLSALLLFLMIFSTTGNPVVSAVCISVAVPVFSVLSHMLGNRLFLTIPGIAFVAGLFIGGINQALNVLLISAMSYALSNAIITKGREAKSSAIARCTVISVIFTVISFVISVYIRKLFTIHEFFDVINRIFDMVKAQTVASYESIFELYSRNGIDTALSVADFEKVTEVLVFQTKTVIPAVYVIVLTVFSYITVSLVSPIAKLTGNRDMIPGKKFEVTISMWTAVIYFVSSIAILFASGSADFGFRNITYILTPPLGLCGLKQTIVFFRKKDVPDFACHLIAAALLAVALFLGDIGVSVLVIAGMFYATSPENRGM